MPRVDLWAVHLLGPDELVPCRCREAAERMAKWINLKWITSPDRVAVTPGPVAAVVRWPHDQASHATELARLTRQEATHV